MLLEYQSQPFAQLLKTDGICVLLYVIAIGAKIALSFACTSLVHRTGK